MGLGWAWELGSVLETERELGSVWASALELVTVAAWVLVWEQVRRSRFPRIVRR